MSAAGGGQPPALHVDAHLDLEVGGVVHQLRGEGSTLRLTSPDPQGLLGALPSAGRGDLADLADGFEQLGLTVELARPDGRVTARLGADVSSTAGRVLTGSRRVEVDAARLAAPAVRARATSAAPRSRRLLVAAGVAIAAVVGWAVAR